MCNITNTRAQRNEKRGIKDLLQQKKSQTYNIYTIATMENASTLTVISPKNHGTNNDIKDTKKIKSFNFVETHANHKASIFECKKKKM